MEPIAPALEKIVTRSIRRSVNSPLLAWPLACGSAVAERTQAVSFAYGVLRIQVPDPGWRTELQQLAPRYLLALNRYAAESVNRIEFVLRDQVEHKNDLSPGGANDRSPALQRWEAPKKHQVP